MKLIILIAMLFAFGCASTKECPCVEEQCSKVECTCEDCQCEDCPGCPECPGPEVPEPKKIK